MVYGVILAGGVGRRMGGEKPKQYLTVKNKPIIIYTIEKFFTNPNIDKLLFYVQGNGLSIPTTLLKNILHRQWISSLLFRAVQQEMKPL